MKILYLCSDPGIPVLGRKGAAVHVRGLVGALARAGHAVVLASPVLNKSPWRKPADVQVPVLHLPPRDEAVAAVLALKQFNQTLGLDNSLPGELRRILYNKQLGVQLRRRFEEDRPDFIYERASLYATAGVILSGELGLPLLLELNAPLALEQATYRATGFGALAAAAERWLLSRADAVLAVSAALRDYALGLGVEPGRVSVLPNGVDPALFRPGPRQPSARARWSLGAGPVLGFVGGLRPWHGVQALPPLLDCLLPGHPGLRLVIAGDGPLRRDLERDVLDRGLAEHVVFTGSQAHDHVAGLVREFDVALAPYPCFGHAFYFSPLKLFEYMACGVPVVAARSGQIAEVVRDGETGLLYPAGDLDAMASACDRLLSDSGLRRRLGDAAAVEVHGQYTWDHNAARVTELARAEIAARDGAARDGLARNGGAPEETVLDGTVGPTRRVAVGVDASRLSVAHVVVSDPFGAASDPEMPSLALALDPVAGRKQLKRRLPRLAGAHGLVRVRAIRVVRHKPGRRCMIEYEVEVERPHSPRESAVLLGKVRAGRYGKAGYQLLDALWSTGFGSESPDGVSVPEPIGVVPRLQMWLQRKVPGTAATDLLGASGGALLAGRIAEAVHKVHAAGVPAERRHTMADELRILSERLSSVAAEEPRWASRIERLIEGCRRLAAGVLPVEPRGIHRDFYSDQVIVDGGHLYEGGRLHLVDFDLYCAGDPALDVGNFLGHVTEQALRALGDPGALAEVERVMEERFVELSADGDRGPEATRKAVRAYATLTLARHVHLSRLLPERRCHTEPLLELCERRLAAHRPRAAAALADA